MASSGDTTIFCNFSFDILGYYSCAATSSNSCDNNDFIISEVKGQHKHGMGNKDVQAFVMENQKLPLLPTGLSSFFPNLKLISFRNNAITKVTKSDLHSYSNLAYLILSKNNIARITEDIFEKLPLRSIEFADNNIEYIVHDLTLPMSLVYIDFLRNKCISLVGKTAAAIDTLKDKLLLRCSHNPQILITLDTVDKLIKNNLQAVERIENLENINKKLKDALKFKLW